MATVRTALVGGGSSGIGRAAAAHLAASGHRVVLVGRRAEPLQAAAGEIAAATGAEVEALVHDMADAATAADAVEQVEDRFGSLDVLVLNAGGPPPSRILEADAAQWQAAFDLLLLGPVRLAQLAMPAMAKRGFGRVVVVTSNGVRQPIPALATSVVLRAAMTSAAKLLSREFAAQGVTVNCVAPGATDTPRRREVLTARAAAAGVELADAEAQDAADIPTGRAGTADEIGAAIAFLASVAASFVNGTVLTVDGGRTEAV